jgi:mono/diheme cytochrome c family protein
VINNHKKHKRHGTSQLLLVPFVLLVVSSASVPAPAQTPVTFHKDVLPILQKNCQSCHRPGEAAPMSLLDYKGVRPWAKAIKSAVLAKTMPPWFADPDYGEVKTTGG